MNDKQLMIELGELVTLLDGEIDNETDIERNCRLQDAKELLRRAWYKLDGSPCVDNDMLCK